MHLQTLAFFPWTQASSSGFRSFILSNCTGLVRIRAFHSLDSVFPCPPASSAVSRCNFYFTLKSTFLAPFSRHGIGEQETHFPLALRSRGATRLPTRGMGFQAVTSGRNLQPDPP
jgi:hypothetical protein